MSQTSKCKSCGAEIVWAKTAASGKAIPLDAQPCADGNLVLVNDVVFTPYTLDAAEKRPHYYKSHFATCPNAARHRKPPQGGSGTAPS